MVTGVELVTALVLTVKFALLAPAARVTVEGTLADHCHWKAALARHQWVRPTQRHCAG